MKRILIVDDELAILMALSHLLSNENTLVITSSRIEEAEEALYRYKFDLIIADIRLSGIEGMEGLELLSYVKNISPEIKVILMTAYGSDEIKESAYQRGAYHYYEKPIDMDDLTKKVEDCGIPVMIQK
ncbi:MAG: Nitrogen regulation protein NR(I) [candidate division WS2 bacterium]|nr:Nitrogen regulation protein NR(I) [Candidatus Lithacetigena glycinireducens]